MKTVLAAIVAGLSIVLVIRWKSSRARGARAAEEVQKSYRLTSSVRTPEKNAAVGGHPQSKHLIGLAWDFAAIPARRMTARDAVFIADIYRKHTSERVVVVNEGDHIHVQIG